MNSFWRSVLATLIQAFAAKGVEKLQPKDKK